VLCRSLQRVWEGEEGRKTRIKNERKKERNTNRKKKRKRKTELLVTDILYQYCNKNSQD